MSPSEPIDQELKAFVAAALSDLADVVRRVRPAGSEQELRELQERLHSSQFVLAALGAFNRGKSMLLNALLGMDVLPTGIVPLTSVATRVRWGPSIRTRIEFADGRLVEIPLEDLPAYVTETHNPANGKGVLRVDVEVPSPFLEGGLVLLDTPGIGSAVEEATKTTMRLLPTIDAAIVVLSVDPPISSEELAFIHSIRQYVGKLFFVLNKIDYVDEREWLEALNYCRRALMEALDQEPVELFPLSARLGLHERRMGEVGKAEESRMGLFVERLLRFLAEGKGRAILSAVSATALRVAWDLELRLQIEWKTLRANQQEREDLRHRLGELQRVLDERRDTTFHILRGEISKISDQVNDRVETYREDAFRRLREEVKTFVHGLQGSPRERAVRTDAFIHGRVGEACQKFLREEETALEGEMQRATEMATHEMNRAIEGVRQELANVLGWDVPRLPLRIELPASERLWFKFEEQLYRRGSTLETVGSLVGALSKKRMEERAEEALWEELDRNLGRIRSDLQERLAQAVRVWEAEAEKSFGSLRDAIRQGMTVNPSGDVVERIRDLERDGQVLASVTERLTAVRKEGRVATKGGNQAGAAPHTSNQHTSGTEQGAVPRISSPQT